MIETIDTEKRRAVLVGAETCGDRRFGVSMQELRGLAEACNFEVCAEITQKLDRPDSASYVGSGKLAEIRQELFLADADCVIFLNTLTPSQLSNLSHDTEAEVLDKTGLILRIFGERARTKEAKLQVESAKLKYMLPRLSGLRQNLSRQGGTGGSMSNKGAGEKQIELDRRHIEKRMAELRKELAAIESGRGTRRKRRLAAGIPLVVLVGYTNAGKSSLLNAMIDVFCPDEEKKVTEKNMLFATLDTTVRRITPGGNKDFLLSDTVGFIHDLPHELVRAFRSTLEEAMLADLIVQVVDYSDENYRSHMDVTEKTLQELGAGGIPMLYVMNKAELKAESGALPSVMGDRIYLSARNRIGIKELAEMITEKLYGDLVLCECLIPYADGAAEHLLRTRSEILESAYREDGIYLKAKVSRMLLGQIKNYAIK